MFLSEICRCGHGFWSSHKEHSYFSRNENCKVGMCSCFEFKPWLSDAIRLNFRISKC